MTYGLAIYGETGDIIISNVHRFTRFHSTASVIVAQNGSYNGDISVVGMEDNDSWQVIVQNYQNNMSVFKKTDAFTFIYPNNPYIGNMLVQFVILRV